MITADAGQVRQSPSFVRITTDQYHRMLETGIVEEGAAIELLDGLLVLKNRAAYVPGCHDESQMLRLTVDQYHEMIRTGILREGEPIELIDGLLVWKDRSERGEDRMTVGFQHALVVNELVALNEMIRPHGCFVHSQQPISLPSRNEPEPDGAIVRGNPRTYANGLPTAGDVLCVFEVADSSLQEDRTTKLRIYAQAGIPRYIIVNLIERCLEIHQGPIAGEGRFSEVSRLKPGETLSLLLADGNAIAVAVQQLLP
jgi:Uma2 family endonuclease